MESGTKKLRPKERLPIVGDCVEDQIASLELQVFMPLGLKLEVRATLNSFVNSRLGFFASTVSMCWRPVQAILCAVRCHPCSFGG